MPGRLLSNFRFGNLAEHLGLLLLKGVAAVADVARPEDVGLDAIATLLRRDDDGSCYAEDSFVVQLKAESFPSLEYKDHELEWLVSQKQPLFIGRVSLAAGQISLYPTLYVNQAVFLLHATRITIRFGPSGLPAFFRGQKWSAWARDANGGATVWLGDPILQWRVADLVDRDWRTRTYETLKRFIAVARRELELVSFGQCSVLNWSTNDAASIESQYAMMKGGSDDLASVADRCAPGLHALMLQASSMPPDAGSRVMHALIQLAAALKQNSVEIDPDNLFKFAFAFQKRAAGDSSAGGA